MLHETTHLAAMARVDHPRCCHSSRFGCFAQPRDLTPDAIADAARNRGDRVAGVAWRRTRSRDGRQVRRVDARLPGRRGADPRLRPPAAAADRRVARCRPTSRSSRRSPPRRARKAADGRRSISRRAARCSTRRSPRPAYAALPARPNGQHVVADLMAFYFRSSEANDDCYSALINREVCRPIAITTRKPAPLG